MACEYTDMWAMKMRKVFNSLDRQRKGYVTETMLMNALEQFSKDFQKIEKEKIAKLQHFTWKQLYNCGKDVSKDYQLTEEMFLKNMWVSVNQPSFREDLKMIIKETFDKMDLNKDGFVSKEEYLKWNSWKAGEEQALAAFNMMDSDNDGQVSYDEFLDAKVFYYVDIDNPSHPYNLINGPLDKYHTNYTDMWVMKMRKVFNALDRQKKGYLTQEMLMSTVELGLKDHPKVERENIIKWHRHVWKELYNAGKDVPEDYQLTEKQFIENHWVCVNQPLFKDQVKEMFKMTFDQMNVKKKGFVSKEEYLKWNSWRAGEEQALAAFNMMDSDNDGYVSYDELMDAKVFYYTDLYHSLHPYNLVNGPLDIPYTNYTDMWAMKMRKIFNSLDVKKKGYITDKMLWETTERCFKDHPQVEEEHVKHMKQQHTYVWKELYNCGKDVAEDYQLTEEQFIKNMWISVNGPHFKDQVKEMFKMVFDQMGIKKKGFLSKEEYLKWNSWKAGEEQALAAFNMMDSDNDGYITYDELLDAKVFYYTDLHYSSHPYNLINGPLDTPYIPMPPSK